MVGTPCFIAPEQAAGTEIDERADVYALGAILYNVLAGKPPYWDGERTPDQLFDASRELPPVPIASLAPRAPADLRAIVERAMARDRQARYPTAKQMAEELRRFAAGQLLGSREYRLRELFARWIKRHRAVVGVAVAALVVVAAVGAGAVVPITCDGGRLATGSDDGAIRIWDAASARLLEIIHGDGPVEALAWSDDGTRLLAQSTEDSASIWDVHLESRSAAEIDELASQVGWRLVDGVLVHAGR